MLTDIAVAPPSAKSTSLPETNSPMSCCASSVEPPMCGVRMTFSRPRSSETNSSPFPLGSFGNTSIAAPAMCPDSMFARSAAWSTTNPRDRLRKSDRGFIRANSSSPKNPWLPGPAVHVQGDGLDRLEQLLQGRAAARVPDRQPVGDVVEVHRHAEGLGDDRELGADVAVADDAELAAADLVGALGRLVPDRPRAS